MCLPSLQNEMTRAHYARAIYVLCHDISRFLPYAGLVSLGIFFRCAIGLLCRFAGTLFPSLLISFPISLFSTSPFPLHLFHLFNLIKKGGGPLCRFSHLHSILLNTKYIICYCWDPSFIAEKEFIIRCLCLFIIKIRYK